MKLAFGHTARVGKDSAADYLIDTFGGEKLAFARPLKDIRDFAQQRVGFSTKKDRKLLQMLGDWVRVDDPAKLVSVLIDSVPVCGNVFVTDVRYENEFTALLKAGFIMICITRKDAKASSDSSVFSHSSENSLSFAPWHHVLSNESSLSDFHCVLHDLFVRLAE